MLISFRLGGRSETGTPVRALFRTAGGLKYRCQLNGQRVLQQSFHSPHIDCIPRPRGVRRIKRFVVSLAICNDLLGDSSSPGNPVSKSCAENQIGNGARSAPISAGKRVNPIQAPHDICRKMQSGPVPVGVDIFT